MYLYDVYITTTNPHDVDPATVGRSLNFRKVVVLNRRRVADLFSSADVLPSGVSLGFSIRPSRRLPYTSRVFRSVKLDLLSRFFF